ncbi:MAG TPA: 30S ribosomal protein S20 [Acidimicrobiales bacterium]|nr:30S ribosomal protein S20 [Acidimicrobiales bacterium]
MANIKSQIKRNRQNETRRLRNKSAKSEMKTRLKRAVADTDVDPLAEESLESVRMAVKRLDKGAARGIIHKNQAANRKSALMRRVAALQSAASESDS